MNWGYITILPFTYQGCQNRSVGNHQSWLRLHHTVILISNISLKENKPDGVNLNSNDIDYYAQKEKFYGFRQTEVWACIS